MGSLSPQLQWCLKGVSSAIRAAALYWAECLKGVSSAIRAAALYWAEEPPASHLLARDRSRVDPSSPLVQSLFGGESGRVRSGHNCQCAPPALPAVPLGQITSSGGAS
ncbi:hypothetical protein NDU88_004922 [Pleurodeles waltl]|uniref:Uncharacterized protein n=1 Tax=Pleurodeles waltl TaxID=8319 RepID=A0AAV7TSW7_PLEWA|nr:hypothetical protein NDU88_004922 [Pleurodeles waltl]